MSCPDPLHDYDDWNDSANNIDYDEPEWDPIMGDEWIDTDDEWLDNFMGEEDFA